MKLHVLSIELGKGVFHLVGGWIPVGSVIPYDATVLQLDTGGLTHLQAATAPLLISIRSCKHWRGALLSGTEPVVGRRNCFTMRWFSSLSP
jgi:hypothetical protein